PPTITCPANISVNNDAGKCSAVVTYTAPVGTDNCSGATTQQIAGLASGAAFPVGTTTNTFEVTSNGQKTTCSFTVTVVDAEPPTITCPANISVNNDAGKCSAVVNYTAPVGTDNCSGATTVQTTGLASGSAFPVGTTTNTFEVTANGQKTTCSFTVTVVDAEPPTITCPANISVNNDAGKCSAVVNYTAPVGTDNCSGATTTQIAGLASGAVFPVGTTTNTFEVTSNGQKTSCSFTVTVVDAEPPTITCPANISVNNDAGKCSAVVNYTAPVGSDNCSGATTTQIAGLASGAAFPVGTTTNTFEVTSNGQKTTCSFTVTVVDAEPPTITCPANISVNNEAGKCSAVVTYTAPVGTDNCSGATTQQIAGLASGAAFPVGTTTNTFEVTANGQKTTCSFTVTVVDAEPPTITCPANISVNNDAGKCSAVVNYTAPVGTDNCSGATTQQIAGLASGAAFPVGTTTNTFEVTANGQKTSCSFTVTVV
ncbi:HYR domain-containing protein, partial [Runella limosa]|uniref:HYR domain-containing protein n=1 Tax=Runella limosa TaxID=370978 RepID=UPI0004912BF0